MQKDTQEIFDKARIGVITALPKEFAAIKRVFGPFIEKTISKRSAPRTYFISQVKSTNGGYHVVIHSPPLVDMGNNMSSIQATIMLEDFPNIKRIIMVGIAGAVPNPECVEHHVRLGDIVVSDRHGVIQYDFDKENQNFIEIRHPPRPPSSSLLTTLRLLQAESIDSSHPWESVINHHANGVWQRPIGQDKYIIDDSNDERIIAHPEDPGRKSDQPRVFFGPIASANKLLKNSRKRDQLRAQFGVKAIEMEASGIADATWNLEVGYLVIRGTCDYCNSSKSDDWQYYASIVSASFAYSLIQRLPSSAEACINDNQYDLDKQSDRVADVLAKKILNKFNISIIDHLEGSLFSITKSRKLSLEVSNHIVPGNNEITIFLVDILSHIFHTHPYFSRIKDSVEMLNYLENFFDKNGTQLVNWFFEDAIVTDAGLSEWDATGCLDASSLREFLFDFFLIIQNVKRAQGNAAFFSSLVKFNNFIRESMVCDNNFIMDCNKTFQLLKNVFSTLNSTSIDINLQFSFTDNGIARSKLIDDVTRCLEVFGFNTQCIKTEKMEFVDICRARKKQEGLFNNSQESVWAYCDRDVESLDVGRLARWHDEVSMSVKHNNLVKFLYCTNNKVIESAARYAQENQITITSLSELLKQIINFQPYLHKFLWQYENWSSWRGADGRIKQAPLIRAMERCDLHKYYQPLAAYQRREVLGSEKTSSVHLPEPTIGAEGIVEFDPVEPSLNSWLMDPTRNHLTILGDFGSGKTSLLLHLTCMWAKQCLDSGSSFDCVPIFCSLDDYSDGEGIQTFIIRIISERYGISTHWDALNFLMQRGKVVLLLDGLDEMVTKGDDVESARNFDQINRLVAGQSKTILTSRRHYFRTAQDALSTVLRTTQDDPLLSLEGRLNYEVLELRTLDPGRIVSLIQARRPTDATEFINKLNSLGPVTGIINRPILLDMVINSIEILHTRKDTEWDLAMLYDSYVAQWIEHDRGRKATIMRSEGKRRFMETLASEMMLENHTDLSTMHFRRLADRVQDFFSDDLKKDPTRFDRFEFETRTCSFLIRSEGGHYRFVHGSFRDYFFAASLCRELLSSGQIPTALKVSPEIREFLQGRIKRDQSLQNILLEALGSQPKADALEWWLFWRDLLPPSVIQPIFVQEDKELRKRQKASIADSDASFPSWLTYIPGGKFIRGSWESPDEYSYLVTSEYRNLMRPVRLITVDSFLLGRNLVTNKEFREFVDNTGYCSEIEESKKANIVGTGDLWKPSGKALWNDPCGDGEGIVGKDEHPVTQLSYADVRAFCRWRSEIDNLKYRLPTEAEWEFAARGKLGRRFTWGNYWDRTLACSASYWAKTDINTGQEWEEWWNSSGEIQRTTAVGTFPANSLGVFDMVGNVWEWCLDWYDPEFYGSCSEENPCNFQKSLSHVIRGGGWDDSARNMICAFRYLPDVGQSGNNVGFRLCVSLKESK